MPGAAALLLLSPWLDMDPAQAGHSYESNAATDVFFTRDLVRGLLGMYLPDGLSGADPAVNALHAALSGLPPAYVQVGGAESGLADSERFAVVNDQPAAVVWCRGEPFGLAVLTATTTGIAAVTLFGDPESARRFD